jgi:peptidoglycan hydrolase FlgJ
MMIPGITPRPAAPLQQPDRLKEATQQFEAIVVEMLLRQARESAQALSGEGPTMARSIQEGWQDEQLAGSISRSGGLGLGEILYRQLQEQQLKGK